MNIDNDKKVKIILLVEDDKLYRDFLKTILEDESYSIVEASNGIEALDKMKESSFDLVITDILMPEMDGLEMLVKMREGNIETKVIAISGGGANVHPGSFLYASKILGVSATLTKPFNNEELIALIKEVISE